MDLQKIDRLFREKLSSYEIVPERDAWERISRGIGIQKKNHNAFIIKVAAALIPVLVASTLWLFYQENDRRPTLITIDHPVLSGQPIETPRVTDIHLKGTIITAPPHKTTVPSQFNPSNDTQPVAQGTGPASKDELTLVSKSLEKEPTIARVEIQPPSMQPSEITISKKGQAMKPLKIIYIASNEPAPANEQGTDETDSLSTFKKLIALADNFSPVEVISDFKTAKDNFFSSGLKPNKKNENSL